MLELTFALDVFAVAEVPADLMHMADYSATDIGIDSRLRRGSGRPPNVTSTWKSLLEVVVIASPLPDGAKHPRVPFRGPAARWRTSSPRRLGSRARPRA